MINEGELYRDVVDGCEGEGGEPCRLVKAELPVRPAKEGAPSRSSQDRRDRNARGLSRRASVAPHAQLRLIADDARCAEGEPCRVTHVLVAARGPIERAMVTNTPAQYSDLRDWDEIRS